MIKRIKIVSIMFIFAAICGCSSSTGTGSLGGNSSGVKHCSRNGTVDNATTKFEYELNYKGDYVTVLHTTEKVISDDEGVLKSYEDAFREIAKQYDGLKYYDVSVDRGEFSVAYDAVINYAKIDIDKLLDIEGEEDNVVVNGKVKVGDWLDFASKFGVKCE